MALLEKILRNFPKLIVIAATLFFFLGSEVVRDFSARLIIMLLGAAVFLAARIFEMNVSGQSL